MSENLPKVDNNYKQSIYSENLLKCTLSSDLFLVNKIDRDFGLDFYVELLNVNLNTGYSFNIQLKSCRNKGLNNDGSISYSIETSNINYLRNTNIPSYYVLLDVDRNQLFVKSLQDVFNDINKEQLTQNTITLRFEKLLNEENQNIIYKEVLSFYNKIGGVNDVFLSNSYKGNLIGIQDKFINPNEFIEYIEELNFRTLQKECNYNEIIIKSENIPFSIIQSSKYYLILSICGFYLERLPFAKSNISLVDVEDLKSEDKSIYYLFDFILNEDFEDLTISEIEILKSKVGADLNSNIDYLILQTKLNKLNNSNIDKEKYSELKDAIQNSIDNMQIGILDPYILVRFHLLLILLEEKVLTYHIFYNKLNVNEINQEFNRIYDRYQKFIDYVGNKENHFEEIYYSSIISFSRFIIETFKQLEILDLRVKDESILLDEVERLLNNSELFFINNNIIKNALAVLQTKINLYKYKNDVENLKIVEDNFKKISNEIKGLDRKTKKLVNDILDGRTYYDLLNVISSERNSIEYYNNEVRRMNQQDVETNQILNDFDLIEIFPFGYFKLPKEKRDLFFDLLDIDIELKEHFILLWDEIKVITSLNSFVSPIVSEGHMNGNLEIKGIENIKNSFRLRKLLFDNKFYFYKYNLCEL